MMLLNLLAGTPVTRDDGAFDERRFTFAFAACTGPSTVETAFSRLVPMGYPRELGGLPASRYLIVVLRVTGPVPSAGVGYRLRKVHTVVDRSN